MGHNEKFTALRCLPGQIYLLVGMERGVSWPGGQRVQSQTGKHDLVP